MGRHSRVGNLVLLMFLPAAAGAAEYSVLDIQNVPLTGDPSRAVAQVTVPDRVPVIRCDVLIAGAGMGGIGAALAVSDRGHSACVTEETDWVGGQATAGGVPALDENRFTEFAGGTRSYMQFRTGIRDWYRRHRQLTGQAARQENFNPGSCYVSPLCFEPGVGVDVLTNILTKPGIRVFLRTAIFAIERKGTRIESALAWRFDDHSVIRFRPSFVLDATEMGDLLPLVRVPYVVGAESKNDTAEPDAAEGRNPACVQSFTYPFVLERKARASQTVEKPSAYDAIVKRQGFSMRVNYPVEFGWRGEFEYHMFGEDAPIPNNMSPGPFFTWRRLIDHRNFSDGATDDLALINWPRQDYAAESPLDRAPNELAAIMQRAKQTSRAFLYWLQHDVPRDGGGSGYPELRLRPDEMGTADGMSKYPYIRESRRIVARGRVVEQDIVDEYQPGPRAKWFADSVGIGFYMVDIHPCGANEHGRMRMPKPFQIPMEALLSLEPVNFLPAGKSLGVTHLTNGAFRLHPVEWNVGESAGTIASLWLEAGVEPKSAAVQRELARRGVPMVWFDDLASDDPSFAAIQLAALRGTYPLDSSGLHASPAAPVTRGEAAVALSAYFGRPLPQKEAITFVLQQGWMAADHRNWFHPDLPFYWTDWREAKLPDPIPALKFNRTGPVRRRELAERLCGL
jgi:hypothetical protein